MKRHLIWLGAACVFLGGWNFWGTTWGSNTVYLPDGAVCGNLCSDGGFFDAGNGSYADSGIAYAVRADFRFAARRAPGRAFVALKAVQLRRHVSGESSVPTISAQSSEMSVHFVGGTGDLLSHTLISGSTSS